MDKSLTTFKAPVSGEPIRVVERDGAAWFVRADACAALGLVDHRQATEGLDPDERGVFKLHTPGGMQDAVIVSESGLYKLVLRSNRPEALAFRNWVTKDVLPAIRKTGVYVMGEEKLKDPTVPLSDLEAISDRIADLLQRKAEMLEARVAKLVAEKAALAADNAVMAPKADIVDVHVAGRKADSITRFARTLDGVNTLAIKGTLADLGFLWRPSRGSYRVYADYRDKLFVEKLNPMSGDMDIFVTEAGKAKLAELYKSGRLVMKGSFKKAA